MDIEHSSEFVVALLGELRAGRYGPKAWGRFLRRSWEVSLETAQANPALQGSWQSLTLCIATLTAGLVVVTALCEGMNATLHLLPGLLFCVTWQQSDLFWHLGLNRSTHTGKLFQQIGAANTLTWLRALAASYLIARLVGGLSTPVWLVLTVFLFGLLTDILDGALARLTRTQSKLGQIADGEVDFCLYLAVTLILMQHTLLPLWLGLVMLARFLIPLFGVISSYFLLARPVRFGSTTLGKYAGLCQCLYFLLILAPHQFQPIVQVVQPPLLILTLILLVAAPLAQSMRLVRS